MFTLVVRVRKVYHLDRRKFRVDSGFQPNILEILLMDMYGTGWARLKT